MARLEDLTTGNRATGLTASGTATVESAQWIGEQALKVIFRDGDGQLSERLLYRDDEPSLDLVELGRPWSVHRVCTLPPPALDEAEWLFRERWNRNAPSPKDMRRSRAF